MFKKDDKVSVVDEEINGIVSKIEGDLVFIITDDDFEMNFSAKELVLNNEINGLNSFTYFDINQVLKEKETPKKKHVKAVKLKDKNIPPMEVDLHIQKLVKYTKGLSNYEMLTIQLEHAKRQLNFAIQKRIQKVVFVHGVGEGVLKIELEFLFKKYEGLKFYDADYRKYGVGATEVYFFQNKKS